VLRAANRQNRQAFSCGGRSGPVVRRKRSDPAEPWSFRRSASTRSASTDIASWPSGFGWGSGGHNDLVFATRYGTELDAANVRRAVRTVAAAAGLEASEWTPRELRHSFVSLLSSSGVPIEDIAQPGGPCQHERN
jgi:integrase